jgi:menaquinone-dependent protoporphyrinogen IX oxidase
MRRIARKAGADTDTSRDYEYTDWAAVDALVEKLTPAESLHQDQSTSQPMMVN